MQPSVIIAGAGPTGLMLAAELGLAGVRTLVLERLAHPTGESRGLGFNPRTMELFAQRDLLEPFGELATSSAGHFGGIPLDFGVFDGAHFSVNGISQARTEAVLTERVAGLGVPVLRGVEVVGVHDTGDDVRVTVSGPDGERVLTTSWLVGCDGGRGAVRRLSGFSHTGTAPTLEMYLADVVGCEVTPRWIGETTAGGMAMAGPIGGGVHRVIVCELGTPPSDRTGAPPFPDVAAAWRRLTGEDISGGTPRWVSRFTDATRLVTEYRRGRVLLAGDAAHINLPAGGQGMNVGIQDAANLGWKLAGVAAGHVGPELLDTYHSERHAVGERLIRNTRAQQMLNLGGDAAAPMRSVLAELIAYPDVARLLAGMVSGLDVRYDCSGPGSDDHPLLGARLPHVAVDVTVGGQAVRTDTGALLRSGRGVLLEVGGAAPVGAVPGFAGRVDAVGATPADATASAVLGGLTSVLVRPDGHVAHVGTVPGAPAPDGVLARWFGTAEPSPAPADHDATPAAVLAGR